VYGYNNPIHRHGFRRRLAFCRRLELEKGAEEMAGAYAGSGEMLGETLLAAVSLGVASLEEASLGDALLEANNEQKQLCRKNLRQRR
jgi:hypothetical protein